MKGSFKAKAARLLLSALLLLPAPAAARARASQIKNLRPTVILVSLDGFRHDYLAKYRPRNLGALARAGVRARWMTPSFPTKTYPNHYTIATGLYPQRHGIVENNIYDAGFRAVFTLADRAEVENGRWWLGEPIWVTAEKQGQKSASVFFPGTEAEIAGRRPTYWRRYDEKMPNAARVDLILSWLDLPPAERPTCLSLYFSDADDAGHAFGPDSEETRAAVARLDAALGRLVRGLKARGIFGRVNLVVVSDHGMAAVDLADAVVLDEIFDTAAAERVFWTPEIVSIFPRAGREGEIYAALKKGLPPQARVYRKSELPARLHYGDGPRVAPLLVLPAEGWTLTTRRRLENLRERGELGKPKGSHGYDNALASMRALFVAHGPAFKRRKLAEPFANVHVYNVLARVLDLDPAPNDGGQSVARDLLR
ncbi:MAG TPA: ectonucleotide pyrophosphatase/phosphodiesterase [Pyrinomonadaceae bacterium]|nr:ectonucleotide pyrophosphatase/phosphodiesterase [Pyrinomonadaceae bacterium]